MTLSEWKMHARKELKKRNAVMQCDLHAIDNLLMYVLGVSLEYLYSEGDRAIQRENIDQLEGLLARYLNGEPMAYLLGFVDFWSLRFKITPEVLIPRPDSECLVRQIIDLAKCHRNFPKLNILELGVGSGALSIALSKELRQSTIEGIDFSEAAIKIACENRDRFQAFCVDFYYGDWWKNPWHFLKRPQGYDFIFSNPPYVSASDNEAKSSSLRYEPEKALFSNNFGISDIEQIAKNAINYLIEPGWLMLEHGAEQGQQVRKILSENGWRSIKTSRDFYRRERVTFGQK